MHRHQRVAAGKLRQTALAITVLLFPLLSSGWAGTFRAFGPEEFTRATGKPVAVSRKFAVLNPNTSYTLLLHNGGSNGQFERVSSAVVKLNGIEIAAPNDFNQNVSAIEKPVKVLLENLLEVELRGKPGGGITLEIVGVDEDLPTIAPVVDPPPNAAGWHNVPVTVSFDCSDPTSGTFSCTGPILVETEGGNQSVTGTAVDEAGNTSTSAVTINLDRTPAELAVSFPENGATLTSSPVTLEGTVADALSGVGAVTCDGFPASIAGASFSCTVPLVDGVNSIAVEALDVAENSASVFHGLILQTDIEPPTLQILTPENGSLVFENRPGVELSFSDDESGVDTGSLGFTVNGESFGFDCDLDRRGASCTPGTALPEGAVRLQAFLRDLVGNEATAEVQLTVDGMPVEVTIASPEDRLITQASEVQVAGAAGDNVVSVEVNGVSAALSGTTYAATVSLREGTQMLVALARRANGKTGTDSIEVTRDVFAPIVRIDTPREGFVSLESRLTVTGQVNDIVTGGVNPVVRVNGIEATVANGAFMVTDVPLVRGPNLIEAVATDAVGNVGSHRVTVRFQQIAGPRLALVSGNAQVGLVRESLPLPLVIQVTDASGNPLAGRLATFRVSRNSGTLQTRPGAEPARTVQVPTDGAGRASVRLTLGDTSGEGNNRVVATVLGASGEVEFCASASPAAPDKILMVNGDNQRGVVQQPLPAPLEALVVDKDGNPIGDFAVIFSVVRGAGSLDGELSLVKLTGSDGIARTVLTLAPDAGINNNAVTASFEGLEGLPATFVSSGVVPGPPEQTRFRGVVLDNGQTPIPGAVVTVEGTATSATTDEEGQFLLENVPVGHIVLQIDPSASPRPETFPPLEFETVTIAGQTNILGQPILLPALQTEGSKVVGGNEDVTLTMPGVPGLELTVFANSATFPDGSRTGQLTISQVHLDKVPMPPPSGTIFMPPAWTIQPAGVVFDPPARITIPNDGLPAGRVIDIFQFDHALNTFINVGKGTVSEDGLIIESDPGFGITRAGWGGCGLPPPPTTTTVIPPICNKFFETLDDFAPDPAQEGKPCGDDPADRRVTLPLCVTKPVTVSLGLSCSRECVGGECKANPFEFQKIKEAAEEALRAICLDTCIDNSEGLQTNMTDGLESMIFFIECVGEVRNEEGVPVCALAPEPPVPVIEISADAMDEQTCGPLKSIILHEFVHFPGGRVPELAPQGCELSCFDFRRSPLAARQNCK